MTTLIIGGDSEIGAALVASLGAAGLPVAATTRRREAAAGRVLLDLAAPPETWPALPRTHAAILCAAVSRVEACRRDPAGARRVNVEGALAVAARLPEDCFLLFLSTNHVLDGSAPRQSAESPRNPASAYGEQKAEAEERLLALGRPLAILRFAKVLTPRDPLFRDWAASLRAGRPIRPFSDVVNAPTPLDVVCDLVARIVATRSPGLFQASGHPDLTYAEMAAILANELGADAALVEPRAARLAGSAFAAYPRFASLDSGRAEELLGRPVPATAETVARVAHAIAAEE